MLLIISCISSFLLNKSDSSPISTKRFPLSSVKCKRHKSHFLAVFLAIYVNLASFTQDLRKWRLLLLTATRHKQAITFFSSDHLWGNHLSPPPSKHITHHFYLKWTGLICHVWWCAKTNIFPWHFALHLIGASKPLSHVWEVFQSFCISMTSFYGNI